MKIIITTFTIVFLFCGCLTDAKLKKHADMYYGAHPDEFAKNCANSFPVIARPGKDSLRIDTAYLSGDSVPCPPATKDSSGHFQPGKVKCPDAKTITLYHSRVDTVPDLAAVSALKFDTTRLGGEMRQVKVQLIQTTAEKDKAKKQAKNRLWMIIGILGLEAAAAVVIIKLK